MKFHNFKAYAKCGLFLICIISLVGNVYADTKIDSINNLSKPGGIALSWDDSGHIDSCFQFLSIFQKYNATCTMNVNKLDNQTRINKLNALHSAGWEIASHGYDHKDSRIFLYNNTSTAFLNQEIFPSILEVSSYNYPVYTFVYPYSSRNATTDAVLAPYFRTLRTDVPQVVNGNVNETTLAYYKWENSQLLYGIEIDDRSNIRLQSIKYGIDRAIKTGTVLVLYGHLITTNVTGPYQTSTSRLDSILNYTSRNGGVFYHLGDLGNSSWAPRPEFSNVTANCTVSTNSLLVGKSVTFVDYSINQTTELLDFGDGSPTSSAANVIHKYTTPGVYTANLTVKNGIFSASMLKTITVIEPTTPVASFASNSTNGIRPLNIAFKDKSTGFPASWSWDFGDGDTSTSQNPVHEYLNVGNYSVTLTLANDNGSSNIQKVRYITVSPLSQSLSSSQSLSGSSGGSSGENSHSSSSSSGSGGGTGGSPEPQSNVEVKELSQAFISSGSSVKFDFPQKVTPVVYVSFDSKKTAAKTTTIVEMLKGKSTLVSGLPSDEIYKYLNIWVGNSGFATPINIENAVVYFKVDKPWVQDKKIDKSSITLNRYSDNAWNQLPTSLLSEDDKYVYFTAKTPGFSPFAITGKKTASRTEIQPATGTTQPASGDKTQNPTVSETQNNTGNGSTAATTEKTPGQKESPSPSQKQTTSLPGFEVALGMAGLLAVFLYRRN